MNPNQDPDAELVADVRAGRAGAVEKLFNRFYPRVLGMARMRTPNRHEAEDAAIETLEVAIRHLPRFRGESRFSTWLYRVVVNRLRRHRPDPRETGLEQAEKEPDPLPGPDGRTELRDAYVAALGLVRRLPDNQAWVVVLHRLLGLEPEECARVLGASENAVRVRLSRADAALARMRKEQGSEPA